MTPDKDWQPVAYHCGNCGLHAHYTAPQTTQHWRECFKIDADVPTAPPELS